MYYVVCLLLSADGAKRVRSDLEEGKCKKSAITSLCYGTLLCDLA